MDRPCIQRRMERNINSHRWVGEKNQPTCQVMTVDAPTDESVIRYRSRFPRVAALGGARSLKEKGANKAVNSDSFFVRCAHYKCAGYGWRSAAEKR